MKKCRTIYNRKIREIEIESIYLADRPGSIRLMLCDNDAGCEGGSEAGAGCGATTEARARVGAITSNCYLCKRKAKLDRPLRVTGRDTYEYNRIETNSSSITEILFEGLYNGIRKENDKHFIPPYRNILNVI